MALGKYSKVDGRKSSSNYCSTVTLVAFVALCSVGVWMMASSFIVPFQNVDTSHGNKNHISIIDDESKVINDKSNENSATSEDTTTTKNSDAKQFEDNPADLQDEATKKKEDEESKADDIDLEGGETRSDSEGRKPGEEEINYQEGKGTTNGDNSDVKKKFEENDNKEEKTGSSSNEILPSEAKGTEEDKFDWKVCNVSAGSDFIPCLDNLEAIKGLPTTKHYEHRERHCPQDPPTCLVPLPQGYQHPIHWPESREKIWYHNVPHTKLAEFKGRQNWVKVSGEYLTFPGGGTQFKHGALHYIDFIQEIVGDIGWGNHSRVVLDVGCGVASFGGFLFDKDVLTMSLAPKDEHEAQVQFALERGIPALSAVMGTQRLPFPARVFDVVHCARCRVPWHIEDGKLLLEVNRLLRPGGFFIWSATPIYKKKPEDSQIWEAMNNLTRSMCWEVKSISKDKVNRIGVAVYQKPISNECYDTRLQNHPPLCKESDDPNAAWKVDLQACMHKIPTTASVRGSEWPEEWPSRMEKPPFWLLSSEVGVYGKPAPQDFTVDYQHWKRVVTKSYITGLGINWSSVRNVMDMRAVYGGFAAALQDIGSVWVMNVVLVDSPDTLPIIYERGLFGMYHDWCESFSSYPRTYDLLHADHLFSMIKTKCNMTALFAEIDRLLRPEGIIIIRDNIEIMNELEVEKAFRSMHWEVRLTYSKDAQGLLCMKKTTWRPKHLQTLAYAIA
ncbi:probable methyltransferase PMT26 isoform X1 [Lactuca sativa]|uniref:Methyltransferase n=2 Tax=Lactuca sativa TaxID=4236 RepID=A0A9R1UC63_LACSA|nr:probable methyltransferase PMT26 isoform X1 [Lactuca sativa]XP_023756613.1 probable methyltransferase PMT26 isoform X1 [Lactuca sativa]KAJ0184448.1 hypothetical protein LSAT_V11C900488650 [Lactuca sativa]